MKISAILVAAGGSRRMGFDKLAADLGGESVLVRSLLALAACPEVAEIRVATAPEKVGAVTESARRLRIATFVEAVPGGAERHLSVHAALERSDRTCPLVAVHDAARPLATPEAISRCAAVAAEHGAAALAHRVADTLKLADADGGVVGAVPRENLWAMETPQIFSSALLREAYAALLAKGGTATDEVSAVAEIGHRVRLVENHEPNPKITVPGDLEIAKAIWRSR